MALKSAAVLAESACPLTAGEMVSSLGLHRASLVAAVTLVMAADQFSVEG